MYYVVFLSKEIHPVIQRIKIVETFRLLKYWSKFNNGFNPCWLLSKNESQEIFFISRPYIFNIYILLVTDLTESVEGLTQTLKTWA